jgi:hypothetical protein
MFGQLAGYMGVQCWLAANMVEEIGTVTRTRLERRMDLTWDEIPEATDQFMDIAERFLREAIELAGRT